MDSPTITVNASLRQRITYLVYIRMNFINKIPAEQLLRPELENGTLSHRDYESVVNYFLHFDRYAMYPVGLFSIGYVLFTQREPMIGRFVAFRTVSPVASLYVRDASGFSHKAPPAHSSSKGSCQVPTWWLWRSFSRPGCLCHANRSIFPKIGKLGWLWNSSSQRGCQT